MKDVLDILLWAIGILVTLNSLALGFVAKAIFEHVKECREARAEQAALETEVKNIKEEIGTHETGIIGQLHRHKNDLILLKERDRASRE